MRERHPVLMLQSLADTGESGANAANREGKRIGENEKIGDET